MTGPPNPGSDEAGEQGCKCPVLDNNHGKFPPLPPDGWWIVESCPVHAGEGHVGDETICPDCGEDLGETIPHKPECRYA